MTEIPTKRCSRCGETKPLARFYRDHRAKDGRQCRCAACARSDMHARARAAAALRRKWASIAAENAAEAVIEDRLREGPLPPRQGAARAREAPARYPSTSSGSSSFYVAHFGPEERP